MDSSKQTRYEIILRSKRTWFQISIILTILVILIAAGYFGFNYWQNSQQILPISIKNQIDFPVYWPNSNEPVTVNKKTLKYDSGDKILSYVARTNNGDNVTITEQATPVSITASPQVFSQLIQDLLEYEEFDSRNGTVYLTHPKELNGGQAAVMNSQGTLLFAKPTSSLVDTAWRKLFNNLE